MIAPRRRPLRLELVLVVLVSLAALAPGIWSYSLVDPWETHYGEVARMMLQNGDYVHTEWPQDGEGFRSKPVLMFWMMAAGMKAAGVADGGGYSGEMVASARTMIGIRLPFVLSAIAGLTLLWWMLARLVSRRLAWLGLLVVGSTPMFCLMARQAIPDMPLAACTMGAIALFVMAIEDGDRAITPLGRHLDARHVVLALAGGFVVVQAIYYAIYFITSPVLALRGPVVNPAVWLPAMMLAMVAGLSRDGWLIVRLPLVLLGGAIAAIAREPTPARRAGQSWWRHVCDDILAPWARHDPLRYLIRGLAFPVALILVAAPSSPWAATASFADRVFAMAPLTTMRQLYLLGMYFLVGVSVLAKGPPGLTVVAGAAALHIALNHRWRELYAGGFEIKRGLLLVIAVALPWHLAMFFKEGVRFVDEYLFMHILDRAGSGVDNSPGTFEYYLSQLGHGMWLWAALLPAAVAAALLRSRRDTRAGRVRFTIVLWAMSAVATFCLVETKFHHYILPAVPPLALLVAFLLDDLAARRDRLHPIFAAIGIAIVLLICRDLMHEPERWIEMFVFRYDRPWPSAEPWSIDVSDGLLALGLVAAIGLAVAATRFVRTGVALIAAAGLAIAIWALQVYMPHAGTHWGMREAVRAYYEQRTIYGQHLVYFGAAQLYDDWRDAGDTWTFESFIPDELQLGQPMAIEVQLNRASDERITERELTLRATVTAIGDHAITVTFAAGERARLDPWIADGKRLATAPPNPREPARGRPPVRVVDADRLVAWQLYWRGENFWSGDEIWGWLPEMQTAFVNTNNVEFTKYINDRARTPLGRRYFIITEAGRITGVRSSLPTERARGSYEVIDTTSNKFSLAAFYL